MEYNTTREKLVLREYGRNFHKLIEHVKKIKEKEKRTDLSKLIVKLMNMAHPELKNQNEIEQKLWDDLHIMSNFELDVNSPYPIPEVDKLKGIERLEYPKNVHYYNTGDTGKISALGKKSRNFKQVKTITKNKGKK